MLLPRSTGRLPSAGSPALRLSDKILDLLDGLTPGGVSLNRSKNRPSPSPTRPTIGRKLKSPVKAFCLSTVAALAVMAFAQVAPAGATNTQLCKVHQEPCPAAVTSIHIVAGTNVLETSVVTTLCLGSLITGTVGALAAPQQIKVTALTYQNCGTNKDHNNCELTNLALPTIDLLKTALNLGTSKWLGWKVLVKCPGVHCVYGGAVVDGFDFEGGLHSTEAGHGRIKANKLSIPKVEGFLCPSTSNLTITYESLEHLFLVS
jgi:hypothetical protein